MNQFPAAVPERFLGAVHLYAARRRLKGKAEYDMCPRPLEKSIAVLLRDFQAKTGTTAGGTAICPCLCGKAFFHEFHMRHPLIGLELLFGVYTCHYSRITHAILSWNLFHTKAMNQPKDQIFVVFAATDSKNPKTRLQADQVVDPMDDDPYCYALKKE